MGKGGVKDAGPDAQHAWTGPGHGDKCDVPAKRILPRPLDTGYRFAPAGCRRTAGKPCLLTICVYVTSVVIRPYPSAQTCGES